MNTTGDKKINLGWLGWSLVVIALVVIFGGWTYLFGPKAVSGIVIASVITLAITFGGVAVILRIFERRSRVRIVAE